MISRHSFSQDLQVAHLPREDVGVDGQTTAPSISTDRVSSRSSGAEDRSNCSTDTSLISVDLVCQDLQVSKLFALFLK